MGMFSLAREAATGEYRGLSRVERGVKLVEDGKATLREAATALGMDHMKIWRALHAKKEGRPIGKRGRPRLLNPLEEAQLVKAAEEADKLQKGLTLARLREEVCFTPIPLIFFFSLLSTSFSLLAFSKKEYLRLLTFGRTLLIEIWPAHSPLSLMHLSNAFLLSIISNFVFLAL